MVKMDNQHPGLNEVLIKEELPQDLSGWPDRSLDVSNWLELSELAAANGLQMTAIKEELNESSKTLKSVEKTYKCDECSKEYMNKSCLIRHRRNHSGYKQYGCEICGKRFIRCDYLKVHMKRHTSIEAIPDWNSYIKKYPMKRTLHTNNSDNHTKPSKRSRCKKGSVSRINPNISLNFNTFTLSSTNPKDATKMAEDGHSGKDSVPKDSALHEPEETDNQDLQSAAKNGEVVKDTMDIEKSGSNSKKSLENEDAIENGATNTVDIETGHKATPENSDKNSAVKKPSRGLVFRFQCTECGRKYATKPGLLIHLRGHTGERPYTCELCHKKFIRKDYLDEHVRRHYDYLFKCDVCHKKYASLSGYRHHRKTHSTSPHTEITCVIQEWNDDKSEPSNLSDVEFENLNQNILRSLELDHAGKSAGDDIVQLFVRSENGFFACKTCGKQFARKDVLRSHVRTHTGEKPFMCSLCGDRFAERTSLRAHHYTHTGEKPYQCTVCGRRFSMNSSRRRHMKTHSSSAMARTKRLRSPTANISSYRQLKTSEEPSTDGDKTLHHPLDQDNSNDADFNLSSDEVEGEINTSPPSGHKTSKMLDKTESTGSNASSNIGLKPGTGVDSPKPSTNFVTLSIEEGKTQENSERRKINRNNSGKQPKVNASKFFICPKCGKTYCTRNGLIIHSRRHTGEKPFTCQFCSKNFIRKDSLNNHMRMHNDSSFECEICHNKYVSMSGLRFHAKKHSKQQRRKASQHARITSVHQRTSSGELQSPSPEEDQAGISSNTPAQDDLYSSNRQTSPDASGDSNASSDVRLRVMVDFLNMETSNGSGSPAREDCDTTLDSPESNHSEKMISDAKSDSPNESSKNDSNKDETPGLSTQKDNSDVAPSFSVEVLHTNEGDIETLQDISAQKCIGLNSDGTPSMQQLEIIGKSVLQDIIEEVTREHEKHSPVISNALKPDIGLASFVSQQKNCSQKETLECSECGKQYDSSHALSIHRVQHKGSKGDIGSPTEKCFVCTTCGKECTNKTRLEVHYRTHTGQKPYTCNVCAHKFTSTECLKRHIKTHTEKHYECTKCGKRFLRPHSLHLHSYLHTGQGPYKCEKCGKRYARKDTLSSHMRTHSGERPFVCTLCGDRFSELSSLRFHRQTHTGEKPFQCHVCGRQFSMNSSRKRHMKTHSETNLQSSHS